jgi:spermidine synthase
MSNRTTALKAHDFTVCGVDYAIDIEKVYCATKTPYQNLLIGKTAAFGDALFLDFQIQSSETDEAVYHETLIQPAFGVRLSKGRPRSILILGGGEGATLREVLKHPGLERAVMVDIDKEVVHACKAHLPGFSSGAFDDQRVEVVFEGAQEFLKDRRETFDVIVYDLTDPIPGSPSEGIFTPNFIALLASSLSYEGVACFQMGSASLHFNKGFRYGLKLLKDVFASVVPYHVFMASFGLDWGFALATPKALSTNISPSLFHSLPQGALSAMDAESLAACFVLPPSLKKSLGV